MYRPALVIGLGGTGVLALRHLKAELLGSEHRKLPPQVKLIALDTVQEQGASVEGGTQLAALRTELEPGEYHWIGGDVHAYVRQVERGEHPHMSSWFQAETYLKVLPRAAFVLQRGAGQLRQFGRLAIFKDVSAPAQSSIYNLISRAITDIRGTGYFESLDVYLVGSVAGGTGAGMFVDIAYLVRRIAEVDHNNLAANLKGFLVLPEAFSAIPGGIKPSMRARGLAAMRENKRFMVDFDYAEGYPMHYHSTGRGGIWRNAITTKLFDFLYHIDGRRSQNPLTNVMPEFGVAPTIADAIAAMLDKPEKEVENRYAQHTQNVITQASEMGMAVGATGSTAFDSAVGTFTITLPMHHIIEGLSYRLALEAMDALLTPDKKDEDGFVTRLAPDANAEVAGVRGRDAAPRFLEASEVQDWRSGEKVAGTQFLKEVLRIATQYSPNNPALVQELSARPVKAWEIHLEPPGDTAEIRAVRERVQRELESQLEQDVPPASRGERPADALNRILRGVEAYKGYHLGREDPRTGQRVGGQYRLALEEYSVIHLERFRLMLQLECMNILNGGMNPEDPASTHKGGKLGYLLDFLGSIEEHLGIFLKAINEARKIRESRQMRTAAVRSVSAARREMEQKPGGFLGAGARRQSHYLNAGQRLIDLIRASVIEDITRSTVQRMLEHNQELRASAESWARTLGIGFDSLYGRLLRGRRQVANMVRAENEVRVREVIWDADYEERLHQKYAQELASGLDDYMKGLTWRYERRRVGTSEEFRFHLVVRVPDEEPELLGLKDQERNLELLLTPSRAVFKPAWQQESVLKYLMEKYPRPEDLARQLTEKNGPLLALRGGQVVPANYLHVSYGNDPQEGTYLEAVKLAVERITQAKGKLSDIINSADRFKCRLINTLDLVPLEEIESYRDSQPVYRSYIENVEGRGGGRGRLGRETLHIFPAEVNAAKFESRLGELNMPPREFHNDVVLQLEDIDRFRLFVRCWAFEVVTRDRRIGEGGGYENYIILDLPEERLRDSAFDREEAKKLFLTAPASGPPDLLAALKTFNYLRKDVRPDYLDPIDYPRVRRALDTGRQQATDRLLEEGVAITDEWTHKRLEALPPGEQERVRHLYAERKLIMDRQEELKRDALSTEVPITLSDVSTVFYLTLADDVASIELAIDDILKASRGLG